MSKLLSRSIIILSVILGLATIIFVIYYFYFSYQQNKLIKDIFPDKPKIADISQPKSITSLKFDNIFFPNIIGDNIYYFDNLGNFHQLNTNTQIDLILSNYIITPSSIIHIKAFGEERLLIGKIKSSNTTLSSEEDEDAYDLRGNNLEYSILNLKTNEVTYIPIDLNIQEAFWSVQGDILYLLEKDINQQQIIKEYKIVDQYSKVIYSFDQLITPLSMDSLPQNCFYYLVDENMELNKLCLGQSLREPQKVISGVNDALISPNNKYALVNLYKNQELKSVIINIETGKIINNFKYVINNVSSLWTDSGDSLYFVAGENLKVGPENDSLNRRASYVFFRYDTKNSQTTQLSNHNYTDPIDASNLMLNEQKKLLYFTNSYLSRNTLFQLNLK
ncbi:MAG: hypothetical protein NTZ49_03475 [Candidatus Parcubacteria bacterium]|nr:hypothetical protein [Candidatus Parcubacteria bacterium]